jgi:amino acid adenylation domain-containing protein
MDDTIYSTDVTELEQTFDYQKVIYEWNATDKVYSDASSVLTLFEAQVLKNPLSIAVQLGESRLTYHALNMASNRLARAIRARCAIQQDDFVVICMGRSLEMIVGILGILKSGAGYLPIDMEYPDERIKYVIKDSQPRLILTQSSLSHRLTSLSEDGLIPLLSIDNCDDFMEESPENLTFERNREACAYVIYTSGTTGEPKGVVITHQNLLHVIQSQLDFLKLDECTVFLFYASIMFDVSVAEIFSPLISGGSICIVTEEVRKDSEALLECLEKNQVNVALFPSAFLATMPWRRLENLHTVIVGGEVCDLNTMDRWVDGRRLVNAYGPTECSIGATMHEYRQGDSNTRIGKAIHNAKVYVLDDEQNPLLVGVVGELYIGGAGVARGYLNQPGLTAVRFMPNPFELGGRLYRTGDLVRWLADGSLEYVGRNDFQVKIRGMRVELGEIERGLLSFGGITFAVALVKEIKHSKHIVAFYMAQGAIIQEELSAYLSSFMPEYFIPSVFIKIENIPLTLNGKIDQAFLLSLVKNDEDLMDYSSFNDTEQFVFHLFHKILPVSRALSLDDSFFALGGHSLLMMTMVTEIRKQFHCYIPPYEIYDALTIGRIAALIDSKSQDRSLSHAILKPEVYLNTPASYELTPYQLSIYFDHQQQGEAEATAYTIPVFVVFEGDFNRVKGRRAFELLAARHQILTGCIYPSLLKVLAIFSKNDYNYQHYEISSAQ